MTLVSDIILDGYRESNLIAAGASLTATEQTAGLRRLQSIVLALLGGDLGYILEDWNITGPAAILKPSGVPIPAASAASFTVEPNSRLIFNLAAAATLKLDPQPQDGQRFSIIDAKGNFATYPLSIDPNGRKLSGSVGTLVLSTNGAISQWFYRSDTAAWVAVQPINVADIFPFPEEFDDYFIVLLAMRLNPRYGAKLDEGSVARLKDQKELLVDRYSQSRFRAPPPSGD